MTWLIIYPKELKVGTQIFCTLVRAALFTIDKKMEQVKRPSTEKCLNSMWYIHTCVYICFPGGSADIKWNFFSLKKECHLDTGCPTLAMIWMNHGHYAEWNKPSTVWSHLHVVPRVCKFTKPEGRLEINLGWGEQRMADHLLRAQTFYLGW